MRLAPLTGVVVLALAASAHAASWTEPAAFDPTPADCNIQNGTIPDSCPTEPAERVAVNQRGAAAVAWIGGHDRVRVSVADRPGHFGAPVTVASGLEPAVAIGRDGTVTVVWLGDHDQLRFARRPAGGHFGPAHRLAPREPAGNEEEGPRAAAQADGSVEVVFESDAIRAVHISPKGVAGPLVTIGDGGFDHDSVRVAGDGTIAVCCQQRAPKRTDTYDTVRPVKIPVYRLDTGWTMLAPTLPKDTVIETVAASASTVAAGAIDVFTAGDAGTLGTPGLLSAGTDGLFGAVRPVRVSKPSRGLVPTAAVDGSGRTILAYLEKRHQDGFYRTAPVYAIVSRPGATAKPRRQRLDSAEGYEPQLGPLGSGAIAAWQAPHNRWHVAVERGGVFTRISAPAGPGPINIGEDFFYNHDLATAGRYAVLTWTSGDGATRVSEWRP